VAITFEKRSRRIAIGQQMFVRLVAASQISTARCSFFMFRGLQGSYNVLTTKYRFTIPYGAVWLFSIACTQIMYGFVLRPDTLPKTYISWIDQAGQIPVKGVAMNRDLVREGRFKITDIDDLLSNPVRLSLSTPYYGPYLPFTTLGTSPEEPNRAFVPQNRRDGVSAELR
jgi:hypothetical protein